MLRIEEEITFDTPARIALKGLQAEFTLTCRLLDVEHLKALQERQRQGQMSPQEFASTIVVGWPAGQVVAADGAALPYSEANLQRLQGVPGATVAIIRAFYAGYDEATEGNCAPPSAGS